MLSAKNLFKKYDQVQVLKGVDLVVHDGEIVAITGSSGAGKSTLLHLIGTLDKPDSGTISISGENISAFNDKQLSNFRNQRMGFVFQFHHLLPEFSALENVMLPALIAQKKKATPKNWRKNY